MWRKVVFLLIGALLALSLILVSRTLMFTHSPLSSLPVELPVIGDESVDHLGEAVQIATLSPQVSDAAQRSQFSEFHTFLATTYPAMHARIKKETINENSLLYTWKGSNKDKLPVLLLAHQDVVPVEPGTEGDWQYPPFSGRVAGGYIWGRGSWDNKGNLLAMMEALEMLIESGFSPERTIMLAFGHDEETGGQQGAKAIAELLRQRGQRFEFILDEGTTLAKGFIPGIKEPVAMIGIAEKGYLTLSLTVESEGGHSSVPPRITAIGRLSSALHRLQEQGLPKQLSEPVSGMLSAIGPSLPFANRMILANLWLFKPLVLRALERQPFTNAYIRTSLAPTMLSAGVKENLLPQSARAIVNFRVLPGQNSGQVIQQVGAIIDDDGVTVRRQGPLSEPSRMSTLDSFGYRQLTLATSQIFPGVLPVPSLLFAATDSRHYAALSEQVFRFTPITIGPDDLARLHGTNERIAVQDFKRAVQFYFQLLKNSAIVKQQ